jgi:hypothetical protein
MSSRTFSTSLGWLTRCWARTRAVVAMVLSWVAGFEWNNGTPEACEAVVE